MNQTPDSTDTTVKPKTYGWWKSINPFNPRKKMDIPLDQNGKRKTGWNDFFKTLEHPDFLNVMGNIFKNPNIKTPWKIIATLFAAHVISQMINADQETPSIVIGSRDHVKAAMQNVANEVPRVDQVNGTDRNVDVREDTPHQEMDPEVANFAFA